MIDYRSTDTKSSDKSTAESEKRFGQFSDSIPARRLHIDVQTDAGQYTDIEMFLLHERQRGVKKWQTVIAALRFYAAHLDGESEKSSDSETPPYKETDLYIPKKDSERENTLQKLSEKAAQLTRSDEKVNGKALENLSKTLYRDGDRPYTPDELETWYQRVWLPSWKGKRGDIPELADIRATIGQVRYLPPLPASTLAAAERNNAVNDHWTIKPIQRGFDSVRDLYAIMRRWHSPAPGLYQRLLRRVYGLAAGDADPAQRHRHLRGIRPGRRRHLRCSGRALRIVHLGSGPSRASLTPFAARAAGLLPVQIVKPREDWRSFPRDFLDSFDQDVCRAVLLGPKVGILADENVGLRRAKLLAINHPLRALKRVMKYHAKGVEYADWELIKLFKAWDAASPERKAEILKAAELPPEPSRGWTASSLTMTAMATISASTTTKTTTTTGNSRCPTTHDHKRADDRAGAGAQGSPAAVAVGDRRSNS
jgi:hypothetical protein